MEDADEALKSSEGFLICGSTSFEPVNAVNGYVIVQRLQNNGITLKSNTKLDNGNLIHLFCMSVCEQGMSQF